MAARTPPHEQSTRGETAAQDPGESSTSFQAAPNRVASQRPGGTDHGSTRTQTARRSRGRSPGGAAEVGAPGEAALSRSEAVPQAQRRPGVRGDEQGAGPPDQQRGAEGGEGPDDASGLEATATAAAAPLQLDLRAQRLEAAPGPEAFRADCLAFDLGDGAFAYVGRWLTDYCWRESSKHEARQSRSNRRKTLLFYDGDTLVGFGAWRILSEEVEERKVGEVRYLAVIPVYRARGIATVIWSTVRSAIVTSDEGAGEATLIRIDVDKANTDARAVYEHWGFEFAYSYTSDGREYDVLYFRG